MPAVSAAVIGLVTGFRRAVLPTSDGRGIDVDENVFVNRRVAGALTFQPGVTVEPDGPHYVTWLQADEMGVLRFAGQPPQVVALSRRNQGSASDRTAAQTRQVVPS